MDMKLSHKWKELGKTSLSSKTYAFLRKRHIIEGTTADGPYKPRMLTYQTQEN